MLLQNFYVKALNRICKYTRKIDEIWRDRLIMLTFVGLSFTFLYSDSTEVSPMRGILLVFGLFALIILSVDRELKPVKFSRALVVLWDLLWLLLVFAFFDPQADDYRAFVTFLLVPIELPCLYLVWLNRKDHGRLFGLICRTISLVFFIYSVYLLIFYPYRPTDAASMRYGGTSEYPNVLGMLLLAGFTCCMYMILSSEHKWQKAFYIAEGGLISMIIMLTNSRMSLLILLLEIAVSLLYVILHREKKAVPSLLILAALLCAVLPLTYSYVMKVGTELDQVKISEKNAAASVSQTASPAATTAASEDPAAGTQTTHVTSPTKTNKLPSEFINGRMELGNKSLDRLLSARPTVWKAHVKQLRFRGHDLDKYERSELIGYSKQILTHAHNQYIEVAFRIGIPAGIVVLAIDLTAVAYLCYLLFKKGNFNIAHLFIILSVGCYFCVSLIEYPGLVLTKCISLLFYLSIFPIFEQGAFTKEKADKIH